MKRISKLLPHALVGPAILLTGFAGLLSCASTEASARIDEVTRASDEVRKVMMDQVRAWNAGSLDGFLDGYAHTGNVMFVSGTDVIRGFEALEARFRTRYGSPQNMGRLEFDDLQVRVLAPDAALATGSWQVETDKGRSGGRFTLLFRHKSGAWRITLDHTS